MGDTINVIDWEGAKRMPLDEFVKLGEPESRAVLLEAMTNPDYMVDGIVCYQDEDSQSPKWGNRYFVLFGTGPRCSAITAEPLLNVKHKGAGAIAYCEKEEGRQT
jgi:hypothetical protein